MNPSLEFAISDFVLLQRRLAGEQVQLAESDIRILDETKRKFWALNLGRNRVGTRRRSYECLDQEKLLQLIEASAGQREALAATTLSLQVTQDVEEPTLRVCVLMSSPIPGPGERPTFSNLLEVWIDKPGTEAAYTHGGLCVKTKYGLQPVLPGSAEQADIDVIADCFLPTRS